MLKNVINEYIIYKEKIGLRLVQDKLLGMVIYKNLYPKDFADLHVNKGKVYQVITAKEGYIKSVLGDIERQINIKENLIERVEKESLKSVKELRSLYLLALIQKYPRGHDIKIIVIERKNYTLEEAKNDALFSALAKSQHLQSHNYGFENLGLTFKDLEKLVDPDKSYFDREEELFLKVEARRKALHYEIQGLKEKRNRLQEQSLSYILQSVSEDLVTNIKEDKLLIYLLRYGYLDESYYSYISYFYEGSITKEDNDFVLSVKNHEAKPYTFKLTKIEQLVRKLRPIEFETPYVFNFHLLDFILERKTEHVNYLAKIIDQIVSGDKTAVLFLDEYLHSTSHVSTMVEAVAARWSGWWNFIQSSVE
ncbi:MAG: hypothetical protein EOO43_24085, partial [Flavobacterium sp.]